MIHHRMIIAIDIFIHSIHTVWKISDSIDVFSIEVGGGNIGHVKSAKERTTVFLTHHTNHAQVHGIMSTYAFLIA